MQLETPLISLYHLKDFQRGKYSELILLPAFGSNKDLDAYLKQLGSNYALIMMYFIEFGVEAV